MAISKVKIIGAGLIGTSIALAVRERGIAVEITDTDPAAQKLAQELIESSEVQSPELVVIATPLGEFKSVVEREFTLNPQSRFVDIGSVKTKPLQEVTTLLGESFCGSHPMAGREVGGAQSARGDLFLSRPWVITPTKETSAETLSIVKELVEICGATPIEMEAGDHDKAVALISHLPQITSSLLSKQLLGSDLKWLDIAGSGLRDMTRLAGSNPKLWEEILSANSQAIIPLLISLQSDLEGLISNLTQSAARELIEDGNRGRALIPGKHGGAARDYTFLPIVIEDKPGQLSALFEECAEVGVNVEDLSIEHTPGQFTGLVTLAFLSLNDAQKLETHLEKKGWSVQAPRSN